MPNEQKLRQMMREEIAKANASSRFQYGSIPHHTHNGTDSLQIKDSNIIPSTSVVGTLTVASATTHVINLNAEFTPRSIQVNGIFTGTYSGNAVRGQFIGNAQLTPTFYLTDNSTSGDTNVYEQKIQFPFNGKPAQQSSFLWTTRNATANFFAGVSSDHLVSVFYGLDPSTSDDTARVTVTDFSKTSITLDVPVLSSGWTLYLNFTIT